MELKFCIFQVHKPYSQRFDKFFSQNFLSNVLKVMKKFCQITAGLNMNIFHRIQIFFSILWKDCPSLISIPKFSIYASKFQIVNHLQFWLNWFSKFRVVGTGGGGLQGAILKEENLEKRINWIPLSLLFVSWMTIKNLKSSLFYGLPSTFWFYKIIPKSTFIWCSKILISLSKDKLYT